MGRSTPTRSPFAWNTGEPSVFAADAKFAPKGGGLTQSLASSQTATRTVQRAMDKTGRSPGYIEGLKRQVGNPPAYLRSSGVK